MTNNEEIGMRIKNRRKELKYNQQTLADKAGINVSTLTRYEHGQVGHMTIQVLRNISDALGVSPQYILGETLNVMEKISMIKPRIANDYDIEKLASINAIDMTELIQYCLDCGTGIEYTETDENNRRNFTTNKEMREKSYNNSIRYVNPTCIAYFLQPDIVSKTKYILEQKRKGRHIDLCTFDEWVAICDIFNCPKMSCGDATKINGILWTYDITPMEYTSLANQTNTA